MVQLTVILAIIAIIIAILALFIYLTERKLKQKLKIVSSKKTSRYIIKLRRIKNKKQTPEQKLEELNKLAKSFLKEVTYSEQTPTYSSLIELFKKQGKEEAAEFCDLMNKENYSKKKIDKKEVTMLFLKIEKLIRNY